jgi:Tfp pilus assembly protein PilO
LVAAVLALGLAGWFGYLGLNLFSVTRHAREERALLQQAQALSAQFQQAQAAGGKLQGRVLTRAASWTWSDQLPFMVAQVSTLVGQSGVRVQSMQPAPMVAAEKLVRFPLRLALEGNLAGVVTFLRLARRQAPTLGVDQLTVHTGTQTTGLLRAEVTLSSYVMLEGTAGGKKKP